MAVAYIRMKRRNAGEIHTIIVERALAVPVSDAAALTLHFTPRLLASRHTRTDRGPLAIFSSRLIANIICPELTKKLWQV